MKINLSDLKLKTFTEQDALDYCLLNNTNINTVEELYLENNELTDISGVKLFKNLIILFLSNNKIEDISAVKSLDNLAFLEIGNLKFKNESDTVKIINSLKNLETLNIFNSFKTIKDTQLRKLIKKSIDFI